MVNKTQRDARQEGQALIEFALTLPILLLMIMGIIDLARVLFGLSQVIDASRQGVRYGLVQGLERDNIQWFDCTGIRDQIKDLPGLLPINDSNITIKWEDSAGNALPFTCADTLTTTDFVPGDVLAVTVSGKVTPITPLFSSFVNEIPFSYTARRSMVLGGAEYAEEWLEPPAKPQNFSATVDCTVTDGSNNVSFTWTGLAPAPDRMEIRSGFTGEVIVNMNPATNAFCNNCDKLDVSGDMDLYYLVGINGAPPNEIEGPPSSYEPEQCGTVSSSTVTGGNITGTIWVDLDNNGMQDAGIDLGIPNVAVYLESAGDNGIFDGIGGDDIFYATSTLLDGSFEFHSLEVPRNLTAQYYRIVLVPSSVNVSLTNLTGGTVTVDDANQSSGPTTPISAYLGNDDTWTLDNIGFHSLDYYNWKILNP